MITVYLKLLKQVFPITKRFMKDLKQNKFRIQNTRIKYFQQTFGNCLQQYGLEYYSIYGRTLESIVSGSLVFLVFSALVPYQ